MADIAGGFLVFAVLLLAYAFFVYKAGRPDDAGMLSRVASAAAFTATVAYIWGGRHG